MKMGLRAISVDVETSFMTKDRPVYVVHRPIEIRDFYAKRGQTLALAASYSIFSSCLLYRVDTLIRQRELSLLNHHA